MKKILIIHSSLGGGGAERVLIDLLKNIDQSKFSVDLLLIYGRGVYLNEIPPYINYIGCIYKGDRPFYKWFIARLHLGHLFEKYEIRRIVKGHYDTIVSFMENGPIKYHSFITDKADKNVTWVHTDLLNNHYSRYSFMGLGHELRAYQLMDTIVFVSETAKDNFTKLFRIKSDKLVVIHNPIDVNRIKELAKQPIAAKKQFSICIVGRICQQKRYDRLVQAARILVDKNCDIHIDVLGTGPEEERIMELVRTSSLESVFTFHGFCTDPYPFIKRSDAFCLSSDVEGFPTVICEAMALGTPVIATNIVGSRDLLDNNKYGILTDLSPQGFADGIFKLYCSVELREFYKIKSLERSKMLDIGTAMSSIYKII